VNSFIIGLNEHLFDRLDRLQCIRNRFGVSSSNGNILKSSINAYLSMYAASFLSVMKREVEEKEEKDGLTFSNGSS
jgi:hypothetical protein